MKLLLTVILMLSSFLLYAQQQDTEADFLHKIRPENKLDLSTAGQAKAPKKTKSVEPLNKEELQNQLEHFEKQKNNLNKRIKEMEAAHISSKDPDYRKLLLSQKMVNEKIISHKKLLKTIKSQK